MENNRDSREFEVLSFFDSNMNTETMRGKKILIVEDDFFVSDIYQTKFGREGCEVVAVKDGLEAIQSLDSGFVPDIILLDLIMPNMDGREFLKEMKKNPRHSSIPVLVLSNLSQDEDKKESYELGVKEYIVKSHLTPTEVFERVAELLRIEKV